MARVVWADGIMTVGQSRQGDGEEALTTASLLEITLLIPLPGWLPISDWVVVVVEEGKHDQTSVFEWLSRRWTALLMEWELLSLLSLPSSQSTTPQYVLLFVTQTATQWVHAKHSPTLFIQPQRSFIVVIRMIIMICPVAIPSGFIFLYERSLKSQSHGCRQLL